MKENNESDIKRKLLRIKKNISLENAMYMYVKFIGDYLVYNPTYFYRFCDSYGMDEEELLSFLANPSLKNISLYDQMASSVDSISREEISNQSINK